MERVEQIRECSLCGYFAFEEGLLHTCIKTSKCFCFESSLPNRGRSIEATQLGGCRFRQFKGLLCIYVEREHVRVNIIIGRLPLELRVICIHVKEQSVPFILNRHAHI